MKPLFTINSTCKGGGYQYARTEPRHPKANSNGLYPLHRVLVENAIGFILASSDVVHHIDGNKENNDVSNLAVLSTVDHAKLHASTVSDIITNCGFCGKEIKIRPNDYRLRSKRSKTGQLCCSRSCGRLIVVARN